MIYWRCFLKSLMWQKSCRRLDWDPLPLFAFKHKRMNVLLSEIYRSLKQLGLSLKARDFFINSTVALLHILELSVAFFGNGSYSL